MRSILLPLLIILLSFSSLALNAEPELKLAKVLEINQDTYDEVINARTQFIEMETNTGERVVVENIVPDNQAYAIAAKLDHTYMISDSEETVSLIDYYREPVVWAVMIAFALLLLALGGLQGFKALISLVLTGAAILFLLIPAVYEGFNPILAAVLTSAFATATTMILIAGFSNKSLAATIGTTCGVAISGVLGLIVIKLAPLSGLADPEARILLGNFAAAGDQALDFQGILAAGILISSLGAAMDVAISIASSAQELHSVDSSQQKRKLFTHLMVVGKDIMGTMTNTLILAYVGSSMPLLLLLSQSHGVRFLNMEVIATELCAAIIGSIGLLCAIPLTAAASVFLLKIMNEPDITES